MYSMYYSIFLEHLTSVLGYTQLLLRKYLPKFYLLYQPKMFYIFILLYSYTVLYSLTLLPAQNKDKDKRKGNGRRFCVGATIYSIPCCASCFD